MNESKNEKKPFRLEHWKKIAIVIAIYDLIVVSVSYFLALLIRFDFRYSMISPVYLVTWRRFTLIYAFACVIVFILLGLYKSIWRFAGFNEFCRTLLASLLMSAVHTAATLLFYYMREAYRRAKYYTDPKNQIN